MEINKYTIEFLNRKDVQDALAHNDMSTFYELASSSYASTGAITRLLMEAGIDPLQGMTEIPGRFLHNQKDIKAFNIPEGIIKIGCSAFELAGLESIHIPDSVEEIEPWVFSGTESLKEVRLPRGVELGQRCFADSGLESVELEDVRLGSYDFGLFCNCKNLKSAIIKGNIELLSLRLFENCSSLTHVELPTSLGVVKGDVFRGCTKLSKIDFEGATKQWKQIKISKRNERLFNCEIICSDGALKFDKDTRKWVGI